MSKKDLDMYIGQMCECGHPITLHISNYCYGCLGRNRSFGDFNHAFNESFESVVNQNRLKVDDEVL